MEQHECLPLNSKFARKSVLSQHLLKLCTKVFWCILIYLKWLLRDTSFQQDSAPAHRAHDTIEFLHRETPDFIGPELWPANSPDLNPVDYRICGLMEERVYQSPIQDVDGLKQRLISVWAEFKQSVINNAIDQWRPRLRACVRASGQHFKQLIN